MRKTALITGASGGLGEEFARLCAADGYDLVLVARSKERLQHLADELKNKHAIGARIIPIDLSAESGVQDLVHDLDTHGTAVTMLVNNAGFGTYGLFAQSDFHDLQNMMKLNMLALTTLTHQLLPGMIERKHGRILTVSSTAAFQPGPLMAVYYATKAYVMNFSIALHDELSGTGVTCTCLCPGPTQTGFQKHAGMGKSPLFRGLLMDAPTVARIGYRACLRGKPLVTAGLKNRFLAFATRFASRPFAALMARRAQAER